MARERPRYLSDEDKKALPPIRPEVIRRAIGFVKPYKWQLFVVLMIVVASSVLAIFPTLLSGQLIDRGLIGRDMHLIGRLISLSLGLFILSQLLGFLESYLQSKVSESIAQDLRLSLYRHLQLQSQRFFLHLKPGDIQTRLTDDVQTVRSALSGTLANTLNHVITLIVAVAAMVGKDFFLALVGLALIPLLIVPSRMAGKYRYRIARQRGGILDEMNQHVAEHLSISGQLLAKLFNRHESDYESYQQINKRLASWNIRELQAGKTLRAVMGVLTQLSPLAIYGIGGYLMIQGSRDLTVGDLTVMAALIGRMYGPINGLLNLQVDLTRSVASFERLFHLMDTPLEIVSPENPIPLRPPYAIDFSHVSFSYEENRTILDDISFSIREGQTVALVGRSGSGKSTVGLLLLRLYDVSAGAVKVAGVDVRETQLEELRSIVGMVPQESIVFHTSLRDNLLYAKPDASEKELIEVLERANLSTLYHSMPDGLDTLIGSHGLRLSGGEKQRLAIARIMLQNPPILILDEATASLDSISERAVIDALSRLREGRSSLVISHRLSTVLLADEILVLDQGKVAEQGTHEELFQADGLYRELCLTQLLKDDNHVSNDENHALS